MLLIVIASAVVPNILVAFITRILVLLITVVSNLHLL